jgi:hypothetical protein
LLSFALHRHQPSFFLLNLDSGGSDDDDEINEDDNIDIMGVDPSRWYMGRNLDISTIEVVSNELMRAYDEVLIMV